MDLLDFDGEQMYFDRPVSPEVDALIARAAARYGEPTAESDLLRAYFLEPEHLTVLVALYRFFYYQHRYAEALLVAERAIALTADALGLDRDWRVLSPERVAAAASRSMTSTRFLLLALKGAGFLELRLGNAEHALARFETLMAVDTADRLGLTDLATMARARLTEAE